MKHQYGWAFPDLDDFMVHQIKPDGTYQGAHYEAALAYVTDRSLAIDGGAHVGTWTALMSGDFDQVIAVEPAADTFAALCINIGQAGNVDLRNVALGAEIGRVTMVLDGRGAQLKNTGARHVARGTAVACEPIDRWDLPSLGFLKLDVEGSEVLALEGARATLTRCRPIVLFENKYLWKRFGQPRDAPQQLLTRLGYRQLQAVGCDVIWGPA